MNASPNAGLIQPLFPGPVDVVGDVHGEYDALCSLLERLGYRHDLTHPQGRRLVFVGDLVDRGPDSVATVERLMPAVADGRGRTRTDHGNFIARTRTMTDSSPDANQNKRYGTNDVRVARLCDRVDEFRWYVNAVYDDLVPDEAKYPSRFDEFWDRMLNRQQAVRVAVEEGFPRKGRPRGIQDILDAVMYLHAGLDQHNLPGDLRLHPCAWPQRVVKRTPRMKGRQPKRVPEGGRFDSPEHRTRLEQWNGIELRRRAEKREADLLKTLPPLRDLLNRFAVGNHNPIYASRKRRGPAKKKVSARYPNNKTGLLRLQRVLCKRDQNGQVYTGYEDIEKDLGCGPTLVRNAFRGKRYADMTEDEVAQCQGNAMLLRAWRDRNKNRAYRPRRGRAKSEYLGANAQPDAHDPELERFLEDLREDGLLEAAESATPDVEAEFARLTSERQLDQAKQLLENERARQKREHGEA